VESLSSSRWVWVGLVLMAANAWAQYALWFGEQGLIRWRRIEEQRVRVRLEVQEVERRVRELKGNVMLIARDPLLLEEVARRDLGFAYPEEILLVVPDAGKRAMSATEREAAPPPPHGTDGTNREWVDANPPSGSGESTP
jgi:cell division protein FtsB